MRYRSLIIPGLLWAAVAYDMGVVTFTTNDIISTLNVDKTLAGLLVSITLVGWFFGSLLFGYISDKFGRKRIVVGATILHVLATALMALSLSYTYFLVLRFIAGFGFGMVLPVLSAWVSQSASIEIRGRMVVLLDSFWTYGWITASLSAYLYMPHLNSGDWNIYYLLSILWLIAVIPALRLPEVQISKNHKFSQILRWKHTLFLWILWFAMAFSYYGIFVWLPHIVAENVPTVKSYGFIFLTYLAQIPGYFTAAYLVEKVGRRYVIFSFMILTGLSAYLFITNYVGMFTAAAFALSFFDLGAWGALYAYTPELYPDELKGSGAGAASSVGRIGGILGPLIPGLVHWFYAFLSFTLILIIAAFFVLLMPETLNRNIKINEQNDAL